MRRLLAVLLFASVAAVPAFAANRYWTGSVSSNWSDSANWSPAGVPSPGEALDFPAGSLPVRRTLTFDVAAGTSVGAMHFFAPYSVTGNRMTLTGDVTFDPTAACLIYDDLTIGAPLTLRQPRNTTFFGAIDVNGKTLSFASPSFTSLNGPLTGSGAVTSDAPVALSGAGTFSGTIGPNANVGGLYPNATFNGAWLAGTGQLGPVTTQLLSPGEWLADPDRDPHTLGKMRTGPLTIGQLSIDVMSSSNADQVKVTGSVSIGGPLAVWVPPATYFWPGTKFVIIDNDGTDPVSGTFSGLPEGTTFDTAYNAFWISYKGGDGNDVVLTAGVPTKTWVGSVSDKWSDPNNWEPSIVPRPGEPLLFPANSGHLTTTNDLADGFTVGPMTFNDSYVLGGKALTLTGDWTFAYGGAAIVRFTCNAPLKLATSARFKPAIQTTFNGPIDVNDTTLTVDTVDTTFNGPINGTGTINLWGAGASLTANGNFAGPITGVINVTGSYPNATMYASRLSGTGTTGEIGGGTIVPGAWRPSSSVEPHTGATLRTATLTSMMGMDVDLNPAGASDRVQVTGGVALSGTLHVFLSSAPAAGQSFIIIDNDGIDAVSGIFEGLPEGSTFSAGGTKLTITYKGGDGNDVVINQAGTPPPPPPPAPTPTTTVLTQNKPTTEMHQPVTFTATVMPASGTATPTGTVDFSDGSSPLGSSALVNGVATLTTKSLALGTHTMTATYQGNSTFASSTSAPLAHAVVKGNPHVSVGSSPAHPMYGDPIVFSITVAADDPSISEVPTGSVTLLIDAAAAGSAALDAHGVATITVPLTSAGQHAVAVTYSGDQAFNSATGSMTQIVAKAPTAVSVDSSANPAPASASIVLYARVSTPDHAAPPADGMLMVSGNDTILAHVQVVGGAATPRLDAMTAGAHQLTALYEGNANFDATSVSITQYVGSTAPRPTPSVASSTFVEGSTAHDETVAVTLNFAPTEPFTVDYYTADITATAGADYVATHGTLTFVPGQTRKTIAIRILGDNAPEPDEAFSIILSTGARAAIVIANDDVKTRSRGARH